MDDSAFRMLTSFIVKGRKLAGPIDSERLLNDGAYAREVFRKVEEEGDEELVLLSLKLREVLGSAGTNSGGGDPPDKDPAGGKYKFGARG